MSVFVMKLIAVLSMITDHLGYFLSPLYIPRGVYYVMRSIGRIAFPVYCFLIVNGYEKTHDVKGYLTRLVTFAAISQVPFVLTFDANPYIPGLGLSVTTLYAPWLCLGLLAVVAAGWLLGVQRDGSVLWPVLALGLGIVTLRFDGVKLLSEEMNVFYTLALGLAAVAVLDHALRPARDFKRLIPQALALAAALLLVRDYADYRCLGIALIVALYLCRERRWTQALMIGLWVAAEYILPGMRLSYIVCAALGMVPVLLYNGKLGKPMKRIFYWIYPLHLLILGILTQLS